MYTNYMAAARSRLPEPDYAALARFRHLVRRFLAFSEQAARKAGLSPEHHQILLALKGLPPDSLPTVGAVAWQLQLETGTVGRRIRRMAARKILRRLPHRLDPEDDLIEVAPRGEALLRNLSMAHRDELRRLAPQLLPALAELLHPDRQGRPPGPVSSGPSSRRGLSPSAALRLRSARPPFSG